MITLLLAEDNELNRDMLSRRLERKDFRVLIATDGQAAVEMTQAELPSLVLLDMNLPRLSGWDVARRLKADPATARIPIVGLSADALPVHRENALAAGCDDYDTKPVDMERLLGKIHHHLSLTPSNEGDRLEHTTQLPAHRR